jgi:hypothetical protein
MSALGGMYYSELCTAIARKLCVLTNGQLSGVVCLEIRPFPAKETTAMC